MSSRSSKRSLPVDGSWRLVEGENESFDTTILPSISDDDVSVPRSSGQPRSHLSQYSSQLSSQGNAQLESQDSIRDFVNHQEDEQVILRQPFRPSVPKAHLRSPDPEFRMPLLDVTPTGGSSMRSSRTITSYDRVEESPRLRKRGKGTPNSPEKRYEERRRDRYRDGDDGRRDRNHDTRSFSSLLFNTVMWTLEVIGLAFRYAQKPLAVLLALYLSLGGIIIAQNMVTKSLTSAISPICRVPGLSLLNLPFCPARGAKSSSNVAPIELENLMGVQNKFEDVLTKSADGVSLPYEMKLFETTIRDVRTLVRHSEIDARDELVLEFDGYIEQASRSVSDLQRFNVHVNGAVDFVISINRWTWRYIDHFSEKAPPSAIAAWTTWAFLPFQPAHEVFSERMLLDQYIEHAARVSDKIHGLIIEAQGVLHSLAKAEYHLLHIFDITTRSSNSVNSIKKEVAREPWSWIGGNRKQLSSLTKQLDLLKDVDSKRVTAVSQVSALILELETIQAGLSDLRERVAEPEILTGISGASHVPLSVHLETIDKNIERLNKARGRIIEVEDQQVTEALERAKAKLELAA